MGVDYPLYMPVSDDFLAGLQLGCVLSESDYSLRSATEGLKSYGAECMFNIAKNTYAPRYFYEGVADWVGHIVTDIHCNSYLITEATKNVLVRQ